MKNLYLKLQLLIIFSEGNLHCVVPENIRTLPMDGHWKFPGGGGGGGLSKAKIFNGKYEAKLEFLEGWGVQSKKPSSGRYGYFLEPHVLSTKLIHVLKLKCVISPPLKNILNKS